MKALSTRRRDLLRDRDIFANICSQLYSSPVLEAVVRVGDDDRPVVEVGGEDEWLHGPVHQGEGLRLPPTSERVVAQVRVEPGEIYL